MPDGELTTGSISSQIYLRLRSGLNHQLTGNFVSGVFATFPQYAAKDFPGYPILVMKNNNVTTEPTFSGLSMGDVDVTITCYSKSSKTCNEAIDAAYRAVMDYDSKSGVDALGLRRLKTNTTQQVTGFIGTKPVHQKDLNITGWTIR